LTRGRMWQCFYRPPVNHPTTWDGGLGKKRSKLLTRGAVDTYDYDLIVKNTLYGTLTRWNELTEKDLSSVDIDKFVGKKTKRYLGNTLLNRF
jgi:hypothetical protein